MSYPLTAVGPLLQLTKFLHLPFPSQEPFSFLERLEHFITLEDSQAGTEHSCCATIKKIHARDYVIAVTFWSGL